MIKDDVFEGQKTFSFSKFVILELFPIFSNLTLRLSN